MRQPKIENEDAGNLPNLGVWHQLQSFHGTALCGHKTNHKNLIFLASAYVVKCGFVTVNLLVISKISGNRNGIPQSGAAGPEPDVLSSEVLNGAQTHTHTKQWSYHYSLKCRKLC